MLPYRAQHPTGITHRHHIGGNILCDDAARTNDHIVMPGVTIGDNSVIGAGSVVTRDIPSGVVAVGNPCKVLREIGQHDREYYWRDRKIDPALFEKLDAFTPGINIADIF